MTRYLRALACAALVGCDMGPHGPGVAGVVEVWVSAPEAYDQALVVAFDRPFEAFTPAEGFRHFPDTAPGSTSVLVVAASPLPAGESWIGSLRVRDLRTVHRMEATVLDAARSDHLVRQSTDGYRVRIAW
jgi:hypothetical protein